MRFKKLMLAAFLLLAVLTIGSVSAADDSLAADNMEMPQVLDDVQTVESPAEDALSYEAGDFNVEINESMDLADEDAAAVAFEAPGDAEGSICVYGDYRDYALSFDLDRSPLTLDDLDINSSGTYFINVSFVSNEGSESLLASGTINVIKTIGAKDFYGKKSCVPYASMMDTEIFMLEESPADGTLLVYVNETLAFSSLVLKGQSLDVYDIDLGFYGKKGMYDIAVKFNTTDGKLVSVEDFEVEYDIDEQSFDDFDSSYFSSAEYRPITDASKNVFKLYGAPVSGNLTAFVDGAKVYECAVSRQTPKALRVSDFNITKKGEYDVEINFTDAEGKQYGLERFKLYFNPDTDIVLNAFVDVASVDSIVAFVHDAAALNGTVALYIDGKEHYRQTFNGTDFEEYIRFGYLNLSEDFRENHTVNVTYNGQSRGSVVAFEYVPYFLQFYDIAIGESSFLLFKVASYSKGNVSLYNAAYNNETHDYDATTLIGTYPVSGDASIVPMPVLTDEGDHVFCANYTVDGKSHESFFRVYAFKNPEGFESNISATKINAGDSITVNVAGPKKAYADFYINGNLTRSVSLAKGTAEYVISNLTDGLYGISVRCFEKGSSGDEYSNSFIVTVGEGHPAPENESGNGSGTEPAGQTTDISNAYVALSKGAFTFNGNVQRPTVRTVGGKALAEGSDYAVHYSNPSSKNAGAYAVTVTGKGAYNGTAKATYVINKAANPLKVKAKTVKVKYSSLKKKAKTLAVSKVVTFTKKGQGTMTYAKSSGNKKITINKKTGKVTIKKGLKKGTYKVKIKIKAKGNANYKASAYKTVTFKIIVK